MEGFTLIEVLIALAIIAIALGAVIAAMGAFASNTQSARLRLLALWSGDNVLGEIVVAQQWPLPGRTTFPCGEGGYRFVCRQIVTQLGSPWVRQVEVRVYGDAAGTDVLGDVITVIQNEARQ